jgi:hypothetical protein
MMASRGMGIINPNKIPKTVSKAPTKPASKKRRFQSGGAVSPDLDRDIKSPHVRESLQAKQSVYTDVYGGPPEMRYQRGTGSAYAPQRGKYGQIRIGIDADNIENHVMHEMQHATDDALHKLYRSAINDRSSPRAQQYAKMYEAFGHVARQGAARSLDPKWYAKHQEAEWGRYRTSPTELGAWATGRAYGPDNQPPHTLGGSHIDATLASKNQILQEFGAKYAKELLERQP